MGKKTKVWAGVLGVALAASVALNWAGAQGRAGFVEGGVSFEGGGVGQALIGDAPARTPAPTVPSANPRLEALRRTIVATVAPDQWAEVGGDGSIVAIDDLDLLVVSQTESNHRDIQALLEAIARSVAQAKGQPAGQIVVTPAVSSQLEERHARIREVLASETKLEFFDESLGDVATFLEEQHGINVEFERAALDDVGVSTDTTVNKQLSGITLHSALNLLLRDLGLTYKVQDEVLMITTPDDEHTHTTTKVYAFREGSDE